MTARHGILATGMTFGIGTGLTRPTVLHSSPAAHPYIHVRTMHR